MSGRISRDTLEELRLRTNIVDIVSEFVDLRRAGSSMKGACPFHSEKTPSFFVSVEKNVFYCFGCGTGGDSITFLMQLKKLDYRESVEELCARSGLDVKYDDDGGDTTAVNAMFDLTRFGADFYHNLLFQKSNPAMSYLKKRGVHEETARELGIGYGGEQNRALARAIRIEGLNEKTAIDCGLLFRRRSGEIVDRFDGRLIFPIFTGAGKVAGFAGRAIDNREPKYINSSESKIYRKKNLLYGMNLTRKYIREEERVFVVEGYMDWITMWQAGIKNVVATCGTAITSNQFRTLKRITDKVILLFDGDLAGKKAAVRAIEPAYGVGCSPMVFFPPDKLDPDDWIRREGPEQVKGELRDVKLLMEYIIEAAAKKFDLDKPSHQLDYVNMVWKYLKNVQDPVEREIYIKLISSRLQLPSDEIKKRMTSTEGSGSRKARSDAPKRKTHVRPEEAMVGFLLKNPEYCDREEVKMAISGFEDKELMALVSKIRADRGETGTNLDTSIYIGDREVTPRISEAVVVYEQLFPDERAENLPIILEYFKLRKKEEEIGTVIQAFRDESDEIKREQLLREQTKLKIEIEEIKKNL